MPALAATHKYILPTNSLSLPWLFPKDNDKTKINFVLKGLREYRIYFTTLVRNSPLHALCIHTNRDILLCVYIEELFIYITIDLLLLPCFSISLLASYGMERPECYFPFVVQQWLYVTLTLPLTLSLAALLFTFWFSLLMKSLRCYGTYKRTNVLFTWFYLWLLIFKYFLFSIRFISVFSLVWFLFIFFFAIFVSVQF